MASNNTIKSKKQVTNLLIRDFNIMQLGYDFMGYRVNSRQDLSFHHMIISHDESKRIGLEKGGYLYWNGAILCRDTAHSYLHLVETFDRFKFEVITCNMIIMNNKGYLDKNCLIDIDKCLTAFEEEHLDDINSKGDQLIKSIWISDRRKFY